MEEFRVIWKPAKITFEEVALTPVVFRIPGIVQRQSNALLINKNYFKI